MLIVSRSAHLDLYEVTAWGQPLVFSEKKRGNTLGAGRRFQLPREEPWALRKGRAYIRGSLRCRARRNSDVLQESHNLLFFEGRKVLQECVDSVAAL